MDDVGTCQAVRLAVRVVFSVLHKQLQLVFASFWEVDRTSQLEGNVRKHSLFVGVGTEQCRDKPRSNMGGVGEREGGFWTASMWILWGSPGMQQMEVCGDPRLPEHF